jgi:hypothetical protein
MKKIFTLLFAAGMITMVQAQPGTGDNRQVDRRDFPTDQRDDRNFDQRDRDVVVIANRNPWDIDDNDRFGNSRFGNERRLKMKVAQINREFDYRIDRVRNNFFMSRWEKQRQIRFLEQQRQMEIRKVYLKYKYNGNGRDFPDNRRY